MDRRSLLQATGLGLGALALGRGSSAAEAPSAKPAKMKLGTVTYNLAKDWDIDTIIKNCEATGFEGVELRTTHAHGVEVTLSKDQRAEVKKRFADSKVELMGLGSAFDYHTPDAAKLRKDIEDTKEYILLAKEVGASGVKVRPNGFPEGVPKEKTREQIGVSLREIGAFGQEHGIQIRLEVHGKETSLVPNIKAILDIADHPNAGACWNSNDSDLSGEGFESNFNLIKDKIFSAHITEIYNEKYPYRQLFKNLNDMGFDGYCLAEIPESSDPVRLMKYYRGLWLALQDRL